MPRRFPGDESQFVFHVYNRSVEDLCLFKGARDYDAFLRTFVDAIALVPITVLAYTAMPNHWHLVLRPLAPGTLSRFMRRLTVTHARRWRKAKGTTGRGALYQGRFKAVPVQNDFHFLRLCHYVERNAVRARLVSRAEDWPWTSACPAALANRPITAPWPVHKPADWAEILNIPDSSASVSELREAVYKGVPYGDEDWQAHTVKQLGLRVRSHRTGETIDEDDDDKDEIAAT